MKIRKLMILGLLLSVALLPAEAKAQKNKNKNKNKSSSQTQSEPASVIDQLNARLLAWDTAGARQLHGQLPDPGSVEAKMASGRLLVQEKRYDEAAAELRAAAAAAAGNPWPALLLGDSHLLAERSGEARKAFEQAVQRAEAGLTTTPEDTGLLLAAGTARQRLRQLPEAVAALEKAHRLAPSAATAFELGVTRALLREWQPAVDRLTEAVESNAEFAYAYYYRALAAEKVGRKDLLINDLNRFLALAPEAPDAERARRILASIR